MCRSYYPNKPNIFIYLDTLKKSLGLYPAHYENTILLGDFNDKSNRFKSLIKDPTCFENLGNPSWIDLISTNSPYSFQNSCVIKTGQSDFYTHFSNDDFRKKILENYL